MALNQFQISLLGELVTRVVLGPSDLYTIASNPPQLTLAPGPGDVIVPRLVTARVTPGTTAYTAGNNIFVGPKGWQTTDYSIYASMLTVLADAPPGSPKPYLDQYVVSPVSGFLGPTNYYTDAQDGFVNKPLTLICDTNFADGDGTLVVVVRYSIEKVSVL
jgi:hypothetical protein